MYKYAYRIAVFNLIFILTLGCGKREPVYEGLPLSTWVERLSSEAPEERGDAARSIGEIGSAAKTVENALRTAARREIIPDVKIAEVLALKSIGADIKEFEDFMKTTTAPIISTEDDSVEYNPDEYYEGEQEPAPGEDDLQYLMQLADGTTDSLSALKMFPKDLEAQRKWAEERRQEQIGTMMSQLQNPDVLAEILRAGDLEERRLAARMLVGRSGVNAAVVDALEGAKFDTDSLIKTAAAEALKKWTRPED
ncbi:MAG: hypothetical protein FJY65_10735 [Calditrichaeota bacterium]|nr:hypothetical protein [Calditrichota bacterium]